MYAHPYQWHDIIGAIHTGIDSIGVTYGYGSFEELSHSNPTYIVDHVDQINDILMGNKVK
ncbi:HAD hydrolase-like protein [Rossellomorea sp. AcN35-11]|nr:HAD hydrolase-like protein [Rossellomorea sp. AcN35-11]